MELDFPKRGEPDPQFACITKLLCNAYGIHVGNYADNSILDTHIFKVEYVDGEKPALSANPIAENMFVQIEEEGNRHILMGKITDHLFDESAVKIQGAFITTSSGTKHRR